MKPPIRPSPPVGQDEKEPGKTATSFVPDKRSERSVLGLLLAIAESDHTVTTEERGILERYRTALRVRAETRPAGALPYGKPPMDLSHIPLGDRVHVLRMMFRVAYADGACSEVEVAMLRRLAGMMKLSSIQFAEIQDSVERAVRRARRVRRLVNATIGVALIALAALAAHLLSRPAKLQIQDDPRVDFQRFSRDYAASVLLIRIEYVLAQGDRRERFTSWGTGFFVTPDGLIATNKHVVQPWKFDGISADRLGRGYHLDEASVRLAAWPGGSRVFDGSKELTYDAAFASERDDLRIALLPPDNMGERVRTLAGGGQYTLNLHAHDDSDLALLTAAVPQAVEPLPLASDLGSVEQLDPVMVLGFPTGATILETGLAETSPSRGEVRKVENSLFVSASIFEGNSGGPVIDRDGRAIGVATRTVRGEATLGSCILSRHVVALVKQHRGAASETP